MTGLDMGKRTFRLEQVLNYRKEIEKVRTREFATARQELEHAEERLRSEEDSATELARELREKQSVGIPAEELQLYAAFSRKLAGDIKSRRIEVACLGEELVRTREHLLEAAKEKKALESVKEKQAKALRRELAEKERSFLDELAIQKGGDKG